MDTVAVVGGSHSAILVLMNLLSLDPGPKVVNLHRSPLRYAEFRNGGPPHGYIVRDNTGLKACQLTSSSTPAIFLCCNALCQPAPLAAAIRGVQKRRAAPQLHRPRHYRPQGMPACIIHQTCVGVVTCDDDDDDDDRVKLHRSPLRYAEFRNGGPPHGYIVRDNIGLKACQHALITTSASVWLMARGCIIRVNTGLKACQHTLTSQQLHPCGLWLGAGATLSGQYHFQAMPACTIHYACIHVAFYLGLHRQGQRWPQGMPACTIHYFQGQHRPQGMPAHTDHDTPTYM